MKKNCDLKIPVTFPLVIFLYELVNFSLCIEADEDQNKSNECEENNEESELFMAEQEKETEVAVNEKEQQDPRFLRAFGKALSLIQEIFKNYFTFRDNLILN